MRALARISPRTAHRVLGATVLAGTLALAPFSAPTGASAATATAATAAEECEETGTSAHAREAHPGRASTSTSPTR